MASDSSAAILDAEYGINNWERGHPRPQLGVRAPVTIMIIIWIGNITAFAAFYLDLRLTQYFIRLGTHRRE